MMGVGGVLVVHTGCRDMHQYRVCGPVTNACLSIMINTITNNITIANAKEDNKV